MNKYTNVLVDGILSWHQHVYISQRIRREAIGVPSLLAEIHHIIESSFGR
jgi:hypothetical protein